MNLTIDVGNSSTKAVLYSADGRREVSAATFRGGVSVPARLAAWLDGVKVDAVMACAVAKGVGPLLDAVNAPVKMELTHATPTPLDNGYATPHTLGLDRLAASTGAWALSQWSTEREAELLVGDLGTACTYDVVRGGGAGRPVFAGGNIAPGVGMRLRALHHYTERLPLVNAHIDTPTDDFGRDTTSALITGALRGVVAEIIYYSTLAAPTPRQVLLTGGWAPELARLMPAEASARITVHPHLVNQGLLSILLYNLQ